MTLNLIPIAAKDGNSTLIPGGVQQHDTSGGLTGPNDPVIILIDSNGTEVVGTRADPKNSATDATAVSVIALLKQVSYYLQQAAAPVVKGYEQITDVSSAVGFTVPSGAKTALVTVEGQGVRWRDDGTNPDADTGMPVSVGSTLTYNGNLNAIKFIEVSSAAILNVSYYG